jgi:DNA ligase-1
VRYLREVPAMQRFAELWESLARRAGEAQKIDALAAYFAAAPAADAGWALFILGGGRLPVRIGQELLRCWGAAAANLPGWLFEESLAQVGELGEALALLISPALGEDTRPLHEWLARLQALDALPAAQQAARVQGWWRALTVPEATVLNRLLLGRPRPRLSRTLLARALSQAFDLPAPVLELRLQRLWPPEPAHLPALLAREAADERAALPYPSVDAQPWPGTAEALGPATDWLLEWHWEGVRAQLMHRRGQCWLWSAQRTLLNESYPELLAAAAELPEETVVDGIIVGWRDDKPQPRTALNQRQRGWRPSRQLTNREPVRFIAFDLLQARGDDLRGFPFTERRQRLEALPGIDRLQLSPALSHTGWPELAALQAKARSAGASGLLLKRKDAAYRPGAWLSRQVPPLILNAVLLYVERGGDFSFGIWQDDVLVPIAKLAPKLPEQEMAELAAWVRAHARERFGPVRAVEPTQVFELSFRGAALSRRHKAGLQLDSPSVQRWLRQQDAADAASVTQLRALARLPEDG